MITPLSMPALPQRPEEPIDVASGGMVTRPLPPNTQEPTAMLPISQQPAPNLPPLPNNPPMGVAIPQTADLSMPKLPEKPQPPPNPQAERLRQRVGAKQYFLQQLGIDWTPDDDDLEFESNQMPDGEDIVRYSVPEMAAIEKKKEPKKDYLELDFEPFSPDDEDGWVEIGASGNPEAQEDAATVATNVTEPLKPRKTPAVPQGVVPPVEVTSSTGTASA